MNLAKLAFRLLLGRRLPITDGTLAVSGAANPVSIRRDGYGIPYIEAESDADAWFGLGFCQAQDRAFTLETMLRATHGTVSELVGPKGLPVDRLSRRLGFLAGAQPQYDNLSPDVRKVFGSFGRGIADGLRHGTRRRAHEFTLLRSQPTPWTGLDALAVSRLQSFVMASNWDVKLARYHMLIEDGPDAVRELEPDYPFWHPVTEPEGVTAGPAADRLGEDLALFGDTVRRRGASNAWAIAPTHTASGRPILANDPHLPPTMPPHWYLAHIRTPEWAIAGAVLVGTPLMAVGHNEVAAWGVTLGMADNTDLYVEDLSSDGAGVRDGDTFVPCETRREVIRVKGGGEVVEEVLTTPRGPIVSPALPTEEAAISVQAKWLEALPVRGLLTAFRARSFEEFRRTFDVWPASLNIVYAASGSVGWLLAGDVPLRRKGWGTIPLAGWDPKVGWEQRAVSLDEMPFVLNPPSGRIVSANSRPIPDSEGPYLGSNWIDGYRHTRISEALVQRDDWDIASTLALQMDEASVPWREMQEVVLSTEVSDPHACRALELLSSWDGLVTADSPAAAVFELFVSEMTRRLAEVKAPTSWPWAIGRGVSPLSPVTLLAARRVGFLVDLLRRRPDGWFDTPWDSVVEESLASAAHTLSSTRGSNVERWDWGAVRPLTMHHPVGSRRPLGSVFDRGPFPWGGDTNTVSQAASDPMDPTAEPLFAASLRMVLDVGNWDNNRFSLPGGQSGNPLSPHYDDMLPLWQRGQGVPIAWTADAVGSTTTRTLRLVPE